ncbi:hypothetical protein [Actinophytocola xanthii]|uniref:Uncharacterized protein n=1 Tax=Actinophytocola xanthii TaxID=1912961 RepID=A0A1Q8CTL0_9PSEU|nr:hypothetical protein [Actinophytocola xanthii]OLF17697.1 hypothetical protein BU204_09320 [Actinophytocola xanthii]
MSGEVLLEEDITGWSARFAVRVRAAVDLSASDRASDRASDGPLDDQAGGALEQRVRRAYRDDVEYLRRLSTVENAAFEVRWLAVPGRPITLTLLGRVDRQDRARARADAVEALEQLAEVPAHVVAEPLRTRLAVERAFTPFRVAPTGLAEVRKPCLIGRPRRADAPMRVYLAVPRLRPVSSAWPGVLELLAAAGQPAMLSVGLVPTAVAPTFGQFLSLVADQYAALGRPGRSGGTVARYGMPDRIDGDPFAAEAERFYRDAAQRYRGTVLRTRITLATLGPLDECLAHGVAERIGRGIAQQVPGKSCVVERPVSPRDQGVALASLRALGVPRWGGHEVWRAEGVPQALRELCELADPEEAAAAAWLPAAATGRLPGGFPTLGPPGADGDGADPGVRHLNSR